MNKLTIYSISLFLILILSSINCFAISTSKISNLNVSENYDLIIITPYKFLDSLTPLAKHKNDVGISTKIFFVETIYNFFEGRDQAEQIKYFIKYAIENMETKYVLLVGDIYNIPIRKAYSSIWPETMEFVLSDHYYADIYNDADEFCSWDSNNNDKFGEIEISNEEDPPYQSKCIYCWSTVINVTDIDGVDLYPDVAVGRLPCSNKKEVNIVVNKIIKYENTVYGQPWFKKIVLAGGDGHPEFEGYEGEETSNDIIDQLPDFEHVCLYTSENNLNARKFNKAINQGAGFVSYSGHGYVFSWGTYPPNGDKMITYSSYQINFLRNLNKLPIIFFNACLTSRLDFTLGLYINNNPLRLLPRFLKLLPRFNDNTILPCLAWQFVKKRFGGAIATLGATELAYSYNVDGRSFAGFAMLDVLFFKNYYEGVTLGEMFISAQQEYLDTVILDYMTLEEFMLIGDPSLRVGGYP
jgi:hypothetical protein